jgi:hypothetical protein
MSYKAFLYDILFSGQTQSPICPILVHLVVYPQYLVPDKYQIS